MTLAPLPVLSMSKKWIHSQNMKWYVDHIGHNNLINQSFYLLAQTTQCFVSHQQQQTYTWLCMFLITPPPPPVNLSTITEHAFPFSANEFVSQIQYWAQTHPHRSIELDSDIIVVDKLHWLIWQCGVTNYNWWTKEENLIRIASHVLLLFMQNVTKCFKFATIMETSWQDEFQNHVGCGSLITAIYARGLCGSRSA